MTRHDEPGAAVVAVLSITATFLAACLVLLPIVALTAVIAPGHPQSSTVNGPRAWGGYTNGRVPPHALCPIREGRSHLLRCDAAAAFRAMATAHHADLGRPLILTDAYRDYAGQVDVYRRKPHLAARPGTSNHGWGLAIDLAVGGWNGATFHWLRANAHHHGWHHPPWARRDGSKPEPWHWEFSGTRRTGAVAPDAGMFP